MFTLQAKKFDVVLPSATVALLCTQEQIANNTFIPQQLSDVFSFINTKNFKAKQGTYFFAALKDKPSILLVGLGSHKDVTQETLRNAASVIVGACQDKSVLEVHVVVPDNINIKDSGRCIAEGLYLSNYAFNRYKTKKDEINPLLEKAILLCDNPAQLLPILKEVEIVCHNTLLCRDLVNETTENANPVTIAKIAKTIATQSKIKCTVFNKKDIEKMKMGLLLAVSQGSKYPPYLIVMHYRGAPKKDAIAIAGKGITFDTGGINLKPSGHIETMRTDMAGAASCIYAINAIAQMKLPVNVYAVIPLAENMISHTAYKPGDVFTAYNGKTVEIGNTDAEGRLILADALSFIERKLKPKAIVDIATLTGACIVSFGEIVAAYLTNDENLSQVLTKASDITGEKIWRMPLYPEYNEEIKSDIADIINVPPVRNAGTIIGAIFLKNFVENTPWAHIDIAGTAWYSKKRGYNPKNATGFGVRLLYEFVKNYSS
ncbi:MAG: leucyl aminopeptidase [Spirochaetes bacterium]|nr:leucyl aminopeptidase [Spirochaetota bacterium]